MLPIIYWNHEVFISKFILQMKVQANKTFKCFFGQLVWGCLRTFMPSNMGYIKDRTVASVIYLEQIIVLEEEICSSVWNVIAETDTLDLSHNAGDLGYVVTCLHSPLEGRYPVTRQKGSQFKLVYHEGASLAWSGFVLWRSHMVENKKWTWYGTVYSLLQFLSQGVGSWVLTIVLRSRGVKVVMQESFRCWVTQGTWQGMDKAPLVQSLVAIFMIMKLFRNGRSCICVVCLLS